MFISPAASQAECRMNAEMYKSFRELFTAGRCCFYMHVHMLYGKDQIFFYIVMHIHGDQCQPIMFTQ